MDSNSCLCTLHVRENLSSVARQHLIGDNGIYCIRLNKEPSDREIQDIVVGVDPGSQKEGFTVKSEKHTYLNVQADAHSSVGQKVAKRRELRSGRRSRKSPNRKTEPTVLRIESVSPQAHVRGWEFRNRMFIGFHVVPVTHVCVEDIKARTIERAKKWNQSFSPLEVGKQWFYTEIRKRWQLLTLQGWQTKEIRDRLGLKKSSDKMSETFDAHCVDSWCLAYHVVAVLSWTTQIYSVFLPYRSSDVNSIGRTHRKVENAPDTAGLFSGMDLSKIL